MLKTYNFDSKNPGKKLLVLGAIHGDEVCGPKAINQIIDEIKHDKIILKNGEVNFVPICNEKAHEKNKRYIDKNLNRIIKKYENPEVLEEKVADAIANLIEQYDYVLDLHSMPTNGIPFAFEDYSDDETKDLVDAQRLNYIIAGWPQMYSTDGVIEDFSTCGYAKMVGVTGITVECGFHEDENSIKVAKQCILNTMAYLGIIDGETSKPKNEVHHITMKKIFYKEKEGSFVKNWKHLDEIKKGETICKYTDGEEIKAPFDCYIIMPSDKKKVGDDWFYLGY